MIFSFFKPPFFNPVFFEALFTEIILRQEDVPPRDYFLKFLNTTAGIWGFRLLFILLLCFTAFLYFRIRRDKEK